MASPGGYSAAAASPPEQEVMDQKKRKRMLSNRESARRSRMRKQQHLDDLVRQVGELKKENEEIMKNLGMTNQMYLNMEAENAILRTQMAELTNRLESLNEIISYINNSTTNHNNHNNYLFDDTAEIINDCGFFFNPNWNQPIMASGGGNNMMY